MSDFFILKKSLDTEVLKYIEILHNGLFPGNLTSFEHVLIFLAAWNLSGWIMLMMVLTENPIFLVWGAFLSLGPFPKVSKGDPIDVGKGNCEI